ncbi:MAG: ABC transporter substrate-binding protein [Bacteroidota bacterium]
MPTFRLALDWTPNINHIGFFVAHAKGFYHDRGLEVTIIDPADDNYALTPAKRVELGHAEVALCPTESVISYRTKATPFDLIGIATVFQYDLSAISVKADAGIASPRDLDGRSYASYQARYEDEIVRQMIRNDGGQGDIQVGYPAKLGIWATLLDGDYDATWIFRNWEGVAADTQGVNLRHFAMRDYDVPYSYSPLIVASEAQIAADEDVYRHFLAATQAGFLFAAKHRDEAVELLRSHVPSTDAHIDLWHALDVSVDALGTEGTWGTMDEATVERFLTWLRERGLESHPLAVDDIVTNRLLASIG